MSSFGAGVGVLILLEDTYERERRFFRRDSSCDIRELRSDFRADATVLLLLEDTSERD